VQPEPATSPEIYRSGCTEFELLLCIVERTGKTRKNSPDSAFFNRFFIEIDVGFGAIFCAEPVNKAKP
jgi:hypothetical protein